MPGTNGHVVIGIDGDASGFESELKDLGAKAKTGLADIKAGFDMVSAAAKAFYSVAASGVQYTANIEQLQTSFEVMTGSAEKAADVVDRLRTMGAETPFEMADLAGTTQLLMQYGFTADDAIAKMKMLGDIAQGNAQAMTSIATGYAQMSSAGKVSLQDIKQMINAGFNPLQEISESTGESMASLYDRISKGKMKVDEITKSMERATSKGGKFFQSMEKQSKTLNGQLSSLQDNASQLLGSLTEGLADEMRETLLPLGNDMISTLQEAFDANGYEGLLDAAADLVPDLINLMSGKLEDALGTLTKFAPKAVDAIVESIPDALQGASRVAPKITSALFDMASNALSGLVGMLPELAPALVTGFAGMIGEAVTGVGKLIGSFYEGIEKAAHQGQEKVLGVWVDKESIAKYDFSIEMEVDVSNAYQKIEDAYDSLRTALNTDLLTEAQKTEILGMIGDDYSTIYEKLKSFGLSEEDSAQIATAVTNVNTELTTELSKLNLSVPTATVIGWYRDANGSRLQLIEAAKKAGLSETDINSITAVYDGMMGRMKNNTPSIVQEIYDKLSDGKPDDSQTVDSLKTQISTYISDLLSGLEEAYQSKLSELDTTAADYETRKAELDAWYQQSQVDITNMDTSMRTLVSTMVNAPTEVVQQRIAEFAEIEAWLLQKEAEIDALVSKAGAAGENAFQVVRSGATTDEATISTALNYKFTQFKVDTQAAQDAYDAAVADLQAKFASGEISKEGYELSEFGEGLELDAAKTAAKEAYESALAEIFSGIAEAEGVSAVVEEAGLTTNMADIISEAFTTLSATEDETGLYNNALGDEFTKLLASYLTIDEDTLNAMPTETVAGYLDTWAASLYLDAETALKNTETTTMQTAFNTALQEGLFTNTTFDTVTAGADLAGVLSSVVNGGAELTKPTAVAAGEGILSSTKDGAANSGVIGDGLGSDFGAGYVQGIGRWAAAAYTKASMIAFAAKKGVADAQKSASPSKVAESLGVDFGDGYSIGLQKSMSQAAEVARRMTGDVATSVDIARSMRVNMPTLQQEIMIANEQMPMSIYVNGRELMQVTAADTNRVQNAYRRSLAVGVGK